MNNWIYSNTVHKTKRLHLGRLLTAAWNQAATVGNGSAGFSACGIYHYVPQKTHHHGFDTSDRAVDESSLTTAVEGAVNTEKPETSFNLPATDQESVASLRTNSAATSLEDISLSHWGREQHQRVERGGGLRY